MNKIHNFFHKINKTCIRKLSQDFQLSYLDYLKVSNHVDIGEIFINDNIQNLIKKINMKTMNVNKVFLPNKQKRELPTIKLLTTEQYEKLVEDAKVRALHKLQPPPFMLPRIPIKGVLNEDKSIENFDTSSYVFTDITFGNNDRERFIVVREPSGVLRKATWEERDRMNQIYFPKEKRELHLPKMFEPEYFQYALEKGKYLFVLDRILIQFEPDHPSYLPFMFQTFDHVIKNGRVEELTSTRYFGPLALYCALRRDVDDVLTHLLETADASHFSHRSLVPPSYLVALYRAVGRLMAKSAVPKSGGESSTVEDGGLDDRFDEDGGMKLLEDYVEERRNAGPEHSLSLDRMQFLLKKWRDEGQSSLPLLKEERVT